MKRQGDECGRERVEGGGGLWELLSSMLLVNVTLGYQHPGHVAI